MTYATYQDSEIAFGDSLEECIEQVKEGFYSSVIDDVVFHFSNSYGMKFTLDYGSATLVA